jgi:hypothetical protein
MKISNFRCDSSEDRKRRPFLRLTRRDLLKTSLGLCGAVVVVEGARSARAVDFTEPDPNSHGLTAHQDAAQIFVRWNNTVIGVYRAHTTQKYPYFGSLLGPLSGSPVTSESSLPYPHHRGVWLGCEPLNGGDYWGDSPLETGQILSTGLSLDASKSNPITINDACNWVGPNAQSPCSDRRTMTVTVPSDHVRLLNVDVTLSANEDIIVRRAKHSLFALRAAPDISPASGGTLMNSSGQTDVDAIHGKPTAWCSYYGRRECRPDVVEGIAVMDHPKNPWSPCPWFVRAYGHLSPSPFNFLKQPWRLDRGQSVRLRYLVVVHGGTPREAGLGDIYDRWISA